MSLDSPRSSPSIRRVISALHSSPSSSRGRSRLSLNASTRASRSSSERASASWRSFLAEDVTSPFYAARREAATSRSHDRAVSDTFLFYVSRRRRRVWTRRDGAAGDDAVRGPGSRLRIPADDAGGLRGAARLDGAVGAPGQGADHGACRCGAEAAPRSSRTPGWRRSQPTGCATSARSTRWVRGKGLLGGSSARRREGPRRARKAARASRCRCPRRSVRASNIRGRRARSPAAAQEAVS